MKKMIDGMSKICQLMELLLAVVITLGILIFLVGICARHFTVLQGRMDSNSLLNFLRDIMNLVIGIEFVKILLNHRVEDVLDLLIIAISRSMIISHGRSVEFLIQVTGVAILFAVRRFLTRPEAGSLLLFLQRNGAKQKIQREET